MRKYRFQAPTGKRLRRLNRRQRKKLHTGQFQEFHFQIRGSLSGDVDDGTVLDAFIEWIEGRDLYFAGNVGRGEIDGLVLAIPGSPTEEDRQSVLRWFRDRPEVIEVKAGEFTDSFYGTE